MYTLFLHTTARVFLKKWHFGPIFGSFFADFTKITLIIYLLKNKKFGHCPHIMGYVCANFCISIIFDF